VQLCVSGFHIWIYRLTFRIYIYSHLTIGLSCVDQGFFSYCQPMCHISSWMWRHVLSWIHMYICIHAFSCIHIYTCIHACVNTKYTYKFINANWHTAWQRLGKPYSTCRSSSTWMWIHLFSCIPMISCKRYMNLLDNGLTLAQNWISRIYKWFQYRFSPLSMIMYIFISGEELAHWCWHTYSINTHLLHISMTIWISYKYA